MNSSVHRTVYTAVLQVISPFTVKALRIPVPRNIGCHIVNHAVFAAECLSLRAAYPDIQFRDSVVKLLGQLPYPSAGFVRLVEMIFRIQPRSCHHLHQQLRPAVAVQVLYRVSEGKRRIIPRHPLSLRLRKGLQLFPYLLVNPAEIRRLPADLIQYLSDTPVLSLRIEGEAQLIHVTENPLSALVYPHLLMPRSRILPVYLLISTDNDDIRVSVLVIVFKRHRLNPLKAVIHPLIPVSYLRKGEDFRAVLFQTEGDILLKVLQDIRFIGYKVHLSPSLQFQGKALLLYLPDSLQIICILRETVGNKTIILPLFCKSGNTIGHIVSGCLKPKLTKLSRPCPAGTDEGAKVGIAMLKYIAVRILQVDPVQPSCHVLHADSRLLPQKCVYLLRRQPRDIRFHRIARCLISCLFLLRKGLRVHARPIVKNLIQIGSCRVVIL